MSSFVISKSAVSGSVRLPSSKSLAIRSLICASLADGKSHLDGITLCDDVDAAVNCLKSLGVKIRKEAGSIYVGGGFRHIDGRVLECRESAAVFRFMLSLCLLFGKETILHGSGRLVGRCASDVAAFCKRNGFSFRIDDDSIAVNGHLKNGVFSVDAGNSSQLVSSLLFVLPLLDGDSTIRLYGNPVSKPYMEMTMAMQRYYGIDVGWNGGSEVFVSGFQRYKPRDYKVDGDLSAAAYAAAFGLEGNLHFENFGSQFSQGDAIYGKCFGDLKRGFCTIDISDVPDLAPILMAVGAVYSGVELVGTRRLGLKESDRGIVMAQELRKFGISSEMHPDSLVVGCGLRQPAACLCSHNDHRIAFALSYLLSLTGGVLDGVECVSKSWPSFFEDMKNAGLKVAREDLI